MKVKINKVTIRLMTGNLLTVSADAIVLPAEPDLELTSDIAQVVGDQVVRELRGLGHCEVGSAVITGAGKLPFKKLIHAVGPRWGEGSERGKLANATFDSLRVAEHAGLRSIAIPAISTGAKGYPLENCALTMLTQIVDYTFEPLRYLRMVILCVSDKRAEEVFQAELERQIAHLQQSNEGHVKA